MEFEWDEEKNKANIRKHKISFEIATKVFGDMMRIEAYDQRHSMLEDRYATIGYVGKFLFVVYTDRGDVTRMISARKASPEEKEKMLSN